MKKLILLSALLLLALMPVRATAGEDDQKMPSPYEGSAELQQLKKLEGTWSGTHQMGEETSQATAVYEVTSNGSAVIEKLFPGTPHEMVSIYSDRGGKLSMTHYCALANQPKMDLVEADDKKIVLGFAADNTLDPAAEDHMHGLTISFEKADTIVQNWSFYTGGQQAGMTEIKLTRVK